MAIGHFAIIRRTADFSTSLLYQVVQSADIKDEELKKIILFRIIANGCLEMTTEGCNALMNSYQNHISPMSPDDVCSKLYWTMLEKNHIFH